jgi:nucleoside-diphosphate-sugar epimerase
VIDCAAIMPGNRCFSTNKFNSFYENIMMMFNLLTAVKGKPLRSFVKISSTDVYGVCEGVVSAREEVLPTPDTMYGLAKYCTEHLCRDACEAMGVPLVVLRCSQLYGPGDTSSKFIPSAINAIRNQGAIQVYGDGTDKRDYLFISDAAELIVRAAIERWKGVYNTASGTSYTLNEVVEMLRRICSQSFSVAFNKRRKKLCEIEVNCSKLLAMAPDFRPTPLLCGLANTCERMR